ncbi:MAG: hypothetical protein AB7U20_06020 [Planctomycetaceae bacterium]
MSSIPSGSCTGRAHELTGGLSTLWEWDARIPEFPVVHAEVLKARRHVAGEPTPPADRDEIDAFGDGLAARGAAAVRFEPAVPQPAVLETAEVE